MLSLSVPSLAMVAQPAEKSCGESVQPFLASILEELMGPVSSGFSEVRALFEKEVDELSQSFHATQDSAQLKEVGACTLRAGIPGLLAAFLALLLFPLNTSQLASLNSHLLTLGPYLALKNEVVESLTNLNLPQYSH